MIKQGVLIRKFRVPSYRTQFWVVIARSFLKAQDVVEDMVDHRFDIKREESGLVYFTNYEGVFMELLFIRPTATPGEIAHECKHALNKVYGHHGVKLSIANDEPECYLLEWFVNRTHQSIKDFKSARYNQMKT